MFSKKMTSLVFFLSLFTSFGASAATNFSGNWFGNCYSNQNGSRTNSLNIYQSATRSINLEGREFKFGQVVETRSASEPGQYPPSFGVAFEVVNLTKNSTAMEYLYSGILRQYPSQPWQAIIKIEYFIQDGTLISVMDDFTSKFRETCFYQKY